jgi:ATP-dependent Clp protease ATP-binding subunit ClpA
MARVIQEHVKRPLADELLFGRLAQQGGRVTIDVKDDKLVTSIEELEAVVSEV